MIDHLRGREKALEAFDRTGCRAEWIALATEENVSGIVGIGRVCRIHRRSIYRALGAGDRRRRRITSKEVLMRRLLAFDYVLDHPQLIRPRNRPRDRPDRPGHHQG